MAAGSGEVEGMITQAVPTTQARAKLAMVGPTWWSVWRLGCCLLPLRLEGLLESRGPKRWWPLQLMTQPCNWQERHNHMSMRLKRQMMLSCLSRRTAPKPEANTTLDPVTCDTTEF